MSLPYIPNGIPMFQPHTCFSVEHSRGWGFKRPWIWLVVPIRDNSIPHIPSFASENNTGFVLQVCISITKTFRFTALQTIYFWLAMFSLSWVEILGFYLTSACSYRQNFQIHCIANHMLVFQFLGTATLRSETFVLTDWQMLAPRCPLAVVDQNVGTRCPLAIVDQNVCTRCPLAMVD